MKLFYPNPFLRSTPISKIFFEIGAPQPSSSVFGQVSSFAKAYSPLRERHSDRSNPSECFSMSSEEPWEHAIYWHPWLVPVIGIKRDRDRDPNDQRDPKISAASASCESEACPNQVPAGLRICRFPDRLSTPASPLDGKSLPGALLPSKSSRQYEYSPGKFGAGDGNRTHDIQLGKLTFYL
jgi:hypothetical protein